MSGTLANVLQILSATSDQSFDDLTDLMKPEDYSREEMQETYEETLGYDPTTYFDRRDMKGIIDKIANDSNTPDEALDYIKDHEETLINDAFEQFDDGREVFLQAAVEQVIEEVTGVEIDTDLSDNYEDFEDGHDNENDESGDFEDSEDEF